MGVTEDAALLGKTPYRLVKGLGSGAMGDVYLAEHTRLKRMVVVKLLRRHLDAAHLDRFRLEAQALAQIRHDNVVDVVDFDTSPDGRPFLVMEYLEGMPLGDYLERRGGFLPVAEALAIAQQAAAGLHAVHAVGVVHRDIKPGNLFRGENGRVKLLDFGVAKLVDAIAGVRPLDQPTRDGMVLGTPKYMAPEQALGREVDARTDLYSLAIVLYRMLTGTTPFERHREVTALMEAHVIEPPPPPSRVAKQPLPAGLDAVVVKALAKRPQDRFPSALELGAALLRFEPSYQRIAMEADLSKETMEMAVPYPPPSAPTRTVDPTVVEGAAIDFSQPSMWTRAWSDPVARALFWVFAAFAFAVTAALVVLLTSSAS
jgi:serine/threonine-protein kinase